MTRYAMVSVLSFAIGILVMYDSYTRREEEKVKQTAEQVRTCKGYLVVTSDGRTTECRSLMPRLDVTWPLPGDPVRLKKREIRRAIGG